jgi:hypothetical protein
MPLTEPVTGFDRPSYLAWLPAFLFRADEPAWRYLLKAWALALVPSVALGALFGWLLPDLAGPDFPLQIGKPLLVFLLVIVSPVVETLILMPLVLILRRFVGPGPAVIASALLWAGAHSLQAAGWGLVVWWPFLIMAVALLAWRARGLWTAFALVLSIHALQNAAGAAFLLLSAR